MNEFLATGPFDLYELQLFHLVAEHRSFTKAGRAAGITQSAITRQIQGMEDRLNARLFERTTRSVRLTPAGAALHARSGAILAGVNDAITALRTGFDLAPKTLRVGIARTIGLAYLPGFFRHFQAKHPRVQLHVSHASSAFILAAVESGELDAGVVAAPPQLSRALHVTHRFSDEFVVIVRLEVSSRVEVTCIGPGYRLYHLPVNALGHCRWPSAWIGLGLALTFWIAVATQAWAEVINTRAKTFDEAVPASAPKPTAQSLRLATFDIDATPPIGSHMAYDPVTNKWDLGLRARGVVLLGAGEPIVLCAVDWIGIANEGHDAFRKALADAARTTPARVSVHTLHQHDAPDCDFSAERLLKDAGMEARQYEGRFQRQVISNLAVAVRAACPRAQTLTHFGLGEAKVEQVASNRRIFGPDGKVHGVRYTACVDPDLRAAPEGTIDPMVSLVSFWNGDIPVAVLSYYATHPQSYYRTGIPNPDFPGLARFQRQLAIPSAMHVHFNGAGGNIGAGKYNDGAPTNRLALAERFADGLRRAWENTRREAIDIRTVDWSTESVALPPSKHLSLAALEAEVEARDPKLVLNGNASRLAWLRRCQEGHRIELGCLSLGRARILHLPGELFVQYQLAAKAQRPDLFVAMAAYGDYAPWYIGTAKAYQEGGYETEPRSSNVAPEVEVVLTNAVNRLLRAH